MTHGDNNGLILPPKIVPTQVIVVPVVQHKENVLEKAQELIVRLQSIGVRVTLDASERSFGWKAVQYEMKGVPLRLEIGPKDISLS